CFYLNSRGTKYAQKNVRHPGLHFFSFYPFSFLPLGLRQIARFRPGQLLVLSVIEGIALGHGENSLFTLSYRVSRVIAEENSGNGSLISGYHH
ncbi:MAG: hypothetical protein QMD04_12895, partial [Anaerolineales bacterium]|nr:hypothetical protein [Anaerolineales bacterium]